MPQPRPHLRRGRIIWASVHDRNGFRKRRPAIILTPTEQIPAGESLEVIAITTTYGDPAPQDHVELPWHPRGHPRTKLNKRAAAVLTWIDRIDANDIQGFGGDVPPKLMVAILDQLKSLGD